MKNEFSRQIFEKFSNIKFNEIPSGGSRVVARRTNNDGANSHFSQCCKRTKKYVVEGVAYCSSQSVDLNARTDTQHDDLIISLLFSPFKQGK